MMEKYKCPHCNREIKEVEVIVLTWKRMLIAAGMGLGCGLLVYPLYAGLSALTAATGAFLIGFVITALVSKSIR
jgi:choline-glycine betaine transporter